VPGIDKPFSILSSLPIYRLLVVVLGAIFGLKFLDITVSDFPAPKGRYVNALCLPLFLFVTLPHTVWLSACVLLSVLIN
jgi:hypothetical protein